MDFRPPSLQNAITGLLSDFVHYKWKIKLKIQRWSNTAKAKMSWWLFFSTVFQTLSETIWPFFFSKHEDAAESLRGFQTYKRSQNFSRFGKYSFIYIYKNKLKWSITLIINGGPMLVERAKKTGKFQKRRVYKRGGEVSGLVFSGRAGKLKAFSTTRQTLTLPFACKHFNCTKNWLYNSFVVCRIFTHQSNLRGGGQQQ